MTGFIPEMTAPHRRGREQLSPQLAGSRGRIFEADGVAHWHARSELPPHRKSITAAPRGRSSQNREQASGQRFAA
jgi:hypothetical protein